VNRNGGALGGALHGNLAAFLPVPKMRLLGGRGALASPVKLAGAGA